MEHTFDTKDLAITNRTHSSPIIGRVNAWFFRWMDWYMHWKYAAMKRRLFAALPDQVVELGAGAGANFRYLRSGTRVIAVEPNVHMHASLERAAQRHGLDLDVRAVGAERIDLPDASVEAVICTLVLCTVEDPAASIREIRRILKPGGRFVCIEHVAAPEGTFLHRLQRFVRRPWAWFFEGCQTCRETSRLLENGGFRDLHVEHFTWPSAFAPVRPQITAIATN